MDFTLRFDKPIQESTTELIQQMIDNSREVLKDTKEPHEAIHQVRKNLKKIRAVYRLVKPEISKKSYKAANTYFRDVARLISEARDVSAMLETTQGLEAFLESDEDKAVLQKAKNYFQGKKGAYTRIQINQENLIQQVLDQLEEAESYYKEWKFKHKGFKALLPGLEETYGEARKTMKNAYSGSDNKTFHEWRKQVKYLRHQLDAISPVWPRMLTTLERELHDITNLLGEEHDLTVVRDQLKSMEWEEGASPKPILKAIKARRQTLKEEAYPKGKKLFKERPADFTRNLYKYYKISKDSLKGESVTAES